MHKSITLACLLALSALPCFAGALSPSREVDPFIGTSGPGNAFPGAVLPWGMVSISPHNEPKGYAAYLKGKPYLYGFGHVHLSGVGCEDMGNLILMPSAGKLELDREKFKSPYSAEEASPGYYRAKLDAYGATAEMTATLRASFSRYSFDPAKGMAHILIDTAFRLPNNAGAKDLPFEGQVKLLSKREVEGYAQGGGFCGAKNRYKVYFHAEFSRDAALKTWNGGKLSADAFQSGLDVGVAASFEPGEPVLVKVGISYVSMANARENLMAELPGWDFDKARAAAEAAWDEVLGKVKVEGGTPEERKKFYTSLYHICLQPNVFSDVNGDYLAMGHASVQKAKGYTQYTIFSLWDTYHTTHPFLTLVYPDRQLDMVKSMVSMAEQGGWLPKWELAGQDTGVMVGDPAPCVIADSYLKGLTQFDVHTAYRYMLKSATQVEDNPNRPGLKEYLQYGYIPFEEGSVGRGNNTLSKALEYAISDQAIAKLAGALGKPKDQARFAKQSLAYKHYFDASTGFLRPRHADGSWVSPFEPYESHGDSGEPGYVEGNAWQYTYGVPHDLPGLMALMGGPAEFTNRLQECFDTGRFTSGNEPDFHYPYLFTYADAEAWRTQKELRKTMSQDFKTTPDGLPGNDDTGATSAWYAFSALGFYPVCPASAEYRIGAPMFSQAVISLDRRFYPGGNLTIRAPKASPDNIYIQSIQLNGRPYPSYALKHADLVKGARLDFDMGPKPSSWAGRPQPPKLLEQPKDLSVGEAQAARFRLKVAGTGPFSFQWSVNGASVTYAAGAVLLIDPAPMQLDRAKVQCRVATPHGSLLSRAAVLNVNPDTQAPEILAAGKITFQASTIQVLFSEPLRLESAQDPGNYSLDPPVAIRAATLEKDGKSVSLQLAKPLDKDLSYTLKAQSVQDLAHTPNQLSPASLPVLLSGDGLLGEYFQHKDLSGPSAKRVDPEINFDFKGAPLAPLGPNDFSVRWTGKMLALVGGEHTFYTVADDGIRLWLDGKLLIDNWVDQGATEKKASINLEAGKPYAIKVEYYQAGGDAVAQLWWSAPGLAKAIVSQSRLFTK